MEWLTGGCGVTDRAMERLTDGYRRLTAGHGVSDSRSISGWQRIELVKGHSTGMSQERWKERTANMWLHRHSPLIALARDTGFFRE